MRLCRYTHESSEGASYGLIEAEGVVPLGVSIYDETLAFDEASLKARAQGELLALADVRLIAPVAPSKIVCVGRNYREHAAELGNPMPDEPLLFLKPPSAVIGPDDSITLPGFSRRVEHEGELGVVIGRRARFLSDDDDPLDYVLGYTCVNDVTARDLQRKDVQFTRAKSFDTFCPVGPFISTGLDPADVYVRTRVNGETRQNGRTGAMAFPVTFLIRYISRVMTLEPGDLIATGTPAGVGPLLDGDVVEVEVEGVGILSNKVRAALSVA
jgi:2-keto-4-pentenoate hydratase/2-oxohepta-3-ene-1,7-dioic acid hydratase in catechol pathway